MLDIRHIDSPYVIVVYAIIETDHHWPSASPSPRSERRPLRQLPFLIICINARARRTPPSPSNRSELSLFFEGRSKSLRGFHTDFIRISHGLKVFKNYSGISPRLNFISSKVSSQKTVRLLVLDFAPPVALFIGQFAFDSSSVRVFFHPLLFSSSNSRSISHQPNPGRKARSTSGCFCPSQRFAL